MDTKELFECIGRLYVELYRVDDLHKIMKDNIQKLTKDNEQLQQRINQLNGSSSQTENNLQASFGACTVPD